MCNNHNMWILHKLSKTWGHLLQVTRNTDEFWSQFTTTVVEVGMNEIYVHLCVKMESVTGSKKITTAPAIHRYRSTLIPVDCCQRFNKPIIRMFIFDVWQLGLQTLSLSQPSWFEAPCMWNSRWYYDLISIPNFIIQNEYIYLYPGSIPI